MGKFNVQKFKYLYVPYSNPLHILKQTTEEMLAESTNKDQCQKNLNKQGKKINGTKK